MQGKVNKVSELNIRPGESQGQKAKSYTGLNGCEEVGFESAVRRRRQKLGALLKLFWKMSWKS